MYCRADSLKEGMLFAIHIRGGCRRVSSDKKISLVIKGGSDYADNRCTHTQNNKGR